MRDLPSLDQIGELPKTHSAMIPSDYLDDMGHMNVMWYTFLFSQGIRGLLEPLGIDRQYTETHNNGTFALEKHVRYLAEVRVGQQVSIYTRLVGQKGTRFHMVQFLVNDTHERLASIMETLSTHVDLGERRSAPMPPDIAARFASLADEHGQLAWAPPLCGAMGLRR